MRRRKQWLRNSTGCPSDERDPNKWDWDNWDNWPDCDKEEFPLEDKNMKESIKKVKECNEPFIDRWNDTLEILPDCDDVWFISGGKICVGMYEPEQRIFCMADGMGVELKNVRQWKYANLDKQLAKYPKEKQIVSACVRNLPCLVMGIFTSHCYDDESGNEFNGLILDEDYSFDGLDDDMAIDWDEVEYWYAIPEEPMVVLDPLERDDYVVTPTDKGIINGDEHVVVAPESVITDNNVCASGDCCEHECPDCVEQQELPDAPTAEEIVSHSPGADIDAGIQSAIANSDINGKDPFKESEEVVLEEGIGEVARAVGKGVLAAGKTVANATGNAIDNMKPKTGVGKVAAGVLKGAKNVVNTAATAVKNGVQAGKDSLQGNQSNQQPQPDNPQPQQQDPKAQSMGLTDEQKKILQGKMDQVKQSVVKTAGEAINKAFSNINIGESKDNNLDKIKESMNEDSKVKEWYISEYPDDDLGEDINPDVSFYDIFDCLDNYQDVYKCIGVGDSVVRERVFQKLADIMGVDYDYVYDQWLKCTESKKSNGKKLLEKAGKGLVSIKPSYYMCFSDLVHKIGREEALEEISRLIDKNELESAIYEVAQWYNIFVNGDDFDAKYGDADRGAQIRDSKISTGKRLREDYGWEIQYDKTWEAYDYLLEVLGAEELANSLAQAMGDDELRDLMAYICRMNDLEDCPYLEGNKEVYEESKKVRSKRFKESALKDLCQGYVIVDKSEPDKGPYYYVDDEGCSTDDIFDAKVFKTGDEAGQYLQELPRWMEEFPWEVGHISYDSYYGRVQIDESKKAKGRVKERLVNGSICKYVIQLVRDREYGYGGYSGSFLSDTDDNGRGGDCWDINASQLFDSEEEAKKEIKYLVDTWNKMLEENRNNGEKVPDDEFSTTDDWRIIPVKIKVNPLVDTKISESKKALKEGDHVKYKGKKYTIDSFLENNQVKIKNESEELIVEANEIKDAVHSRMKESIGTDYFMGIPILPIVSGNDKRSLDEIEVLVKGTGKVYKASDLDKELWNFASSDLQYYRDDPEWEGRDMDDEFYKYWIDSRYPDNIGDILYAASNCDPIRTLKEKRSLRSSIRESQYASYEDALKKLNSGEWDEDRFNDAINKGEITVPNSGGIIKPEGSSNGPEEAINNPIEDSYSFLPESVSSQMKDYLSLIK